jgi:hypothetical protein
MKKELVRLLTSTRVLLLVTAYALPIKAQEAQPVLIFFNRAAGLFDARCYRSLPSPYFGKVPLQAISYGPM